MPTKQQKVRRDRADAVPPYASAADDDVELREKMYQDVEERRLKEWENYQRSHRADEDQNLNRAFIDITVGDALVGRLVLELFDDTAPRTVARFRSLITGSCGVTAGSGVKLDYLHCPLQTIKMAEGVLVFGSMGRHIGTGSGLAPLRDENFTRRHSERGLLTMMSRGPHAGGYAFGITLGPAPVFDFRQTVFGRVVDGMPLLERLEALPVTPVGRPLTTTTISLCGVLTGERPPGCWSGSILGTAAQRNDEDDED